MKQNYLIIKERFKLNNKIEAFPFGLSNITKSTLMEIKDDSSSTFINKGSIYPREKVKLVDIIDFIKEKNISKIDLMKINIEGGEYDLMQSLFYENKFLIIKNLQIHFIF